MSNEEAGLEELELRIGGMLAAMTPAARRKLTQAIGRELRLEQVEHITAQLNPDGTPYAPRRGREIRSKAGAIRRQVSRRKMFRKIKLARYLKSEASADEVAIGFADAAVARIARVHQLGLRDRVNRQPNAPEVTYAERRLLGFTPGFEERILDRVSSHLNKSAR